MMTKGTRKSKKAGRQGTNRRPMCFVIGPIGAAGSEIRKAADNVLKYVIKPAAESCGYRLLRADKISDPGLITHQIIKQLRDADLVVADLSQGNPNVFYELAVRHALRKPVVCLIPPGERPPFDVADVRAVPLHLDVPGLEETTKPELISEINAWKAGNRASASINPITAAIEIIELERSHATADQMLSMVVNAVSALSVTVDKHRDQVRTEVGLLKEALFRVLGASSPSYSPGSFPLGGVRAGGSTAPSVSYRYDVNAGYTPIPNANPIRVSATNTDRTVHFQNPFQSGDPKSQG
jgi:hypothetical protein